MKPSDPFISGDENSVDNVLAGIMVILGVIGLGLMVAALVVMVCSC